MAESDVIITEVREFESGLTESLSELVLLLGEGSTPLSDTSVHDILASSNTTLFVARDNGKIVGMITLIIFRIPFIKKAIVEDIVVSGEHQKHGIGGKLLAAAVAKAKKEGVSYVDLTSRPQREAANIFYTRFGFEKRNTNVYRLKLS